jgi:hypothetical protein
MVEVRWHPDTMREIEVWLEGTFVEVAQRIERQTQVTRMKEPETAVDYSPLSSTKAYFGSMNVDDSPAIASLLKNAELLALPEFIQLIAGTLDRQMSESDQTRLHEFFTRFAPLKADTVRQALQQAIDAKGARLHLRFYLQHLEQVAQRARR